MIADIPATVGQDLHRGDLQGQSHTANKLLISFGSTLQHSLINENFPACEVDFLDSEGGGSCKMWPQFSAGDLLQAAIGRRRCSVTVIAA
jgi:hypothetical protein